MKTIVDETKALSEAQRITRAAERMTRNLASLAEELEAACDRIAEQAQNVAQIGVRNEPET